MKRIILISFLFISFLAKAQQYTNFQGYGFKANRLWADSVSIQPSDTVKNKVAKSIAILNNKLYVADGSKWIIAGGGAVDTFLLSTRAWRQKGIDSVSANVNFRVKYTDTALMLIPYLRKADTITLSNRIDARVKYTDTASMLSPYLRTANYVPVDTTSLSNRIDARVKYTDTSLMLTPYLRKGDTTTLSNRINLKLNIADTAAMLTPYSKLKSVGLSMPSAFSVANSPLTSNGTLAVSGAGTAAQYVRGDGTLATLPSASSGGSAVSYYLNGGTSQGTIGGSTYYQMSKTAVLGTGVDFSTTGNGLLTQFITDVADPNRLEIPAGNWNFEMYFNISSSGGNTAFYVELLKYNGSGFTSIASNIGTPEEITGGTAIDVYLTSLAIPYTTLTTSDRLALRVYIVNNSLGRTVSLHTQDSHLCQVITNFAGGVSALNGLTANTQYFATGTSGTDFNISSVTATHTFNLPTASATNRGALSITDWSSFNGKVGGSGTSGQVAYWNGTSTQTGSNNLFWDNTNGRLGIGTNAPSNALDVNGTARVQGNTTIGTTTNATTSLSILSSSSSNINLKSNGSSDNSFSVFTSGGAIGSNYATFGTNDGSVSGSQGGAIYTDSRTGVAPPIRFMVKGTGTTSMTNAVSIFNTANIGIGQTTDAGYKIDVNGTARVQGDMIVNTVKFGLAGGAIATNIGIGYNTLLANSTGSNNIALGYQALQTNSTGIINVGVGSFSLFNNTTGSNNSMNGVSTFYSNTTGSNNVGFGYNAGRYIADGTTGATIIDNSILIGYNTKVLANSQTNQIVIGYNTVGLGSNTTVLGNSSTTLTALYGSVITGGTSVNASAQLQVESTTKGFLPPRMTTAQRDLIATPAAGLIIYNTSTNKHQGYNGSTWNDFY